MAALHEGTDYRALVTHHGSRGLGAHVYKQGLRAAIAHTMRVAAVIPSSAAGLDMNSDQGREYWEALQYVARWTRANHEVIHAAFLHKLGMAAAELAFGNEHNFVWRRRDALYYHGKGATPAWQDADARPLPALIPLNMASPVLGSLPRASAHQCRSCAWQCTSGPPVFGAISQLQQIPVWALCFVVTSFPGSPVPAKGIQSRPDAAGPSNRPSSLKTSGLACQTYPFQKRKIVKPLVQRTDCKLATLSQVVENRNIYKSGLLLNLMSEKNLEKFIEAPDGTVFNQTFTSGISPSVFLVGTYDYSNLQWYTNDIEKIISRLLSDLKTVLLEGFEGKVTPDAASFTFT